MPTNIYFALLYNHRMDEIKIIELNKKDWTEQEGFSSKGKRVKGWYERNHDGLLFLYKEPKIFQSTNFVTPEIWTEFIAYKIGEYLKLNVPKVILAKNIIKPNKVGYGVLIENFITENEELVEAKEFLTHHDLHVIKYILSSNLMVKWTWKNFKKMLIFDSLIGNNDRHDENWGLCVNIFTKEFKLAPIYDNASCLTNQLDEQKVLKMLLEPGLIERYVEKSRPPNLYLKPDDLQKYTHYELIQELIKSETDMSDLLNDLLTFDYIDYVDDIMTNIQSLDVPNEYKLFDNRKKVILEILKLRRQKLKELV